MTRHNEGCCCLKSIRPGFTHECHCGCLQTPGLEDGWKEEQLKRALVVLESALVSCSKHSWLFKLALGAGPRLSKARDARLLADAEAASKTRLGKLQYDRGFSDGKAGHSPSLLGGPYLLGYRKAGGKW